MKIALLQLNMTVGDISGNARKIESAVKHASTNGADLCVSTEMALTGYPPRDLLLDDGFIQAAWDELELLADALADQPPALVGLPVRTGLDVGNRAYNSAALLENGSVRQLVHKMLLPTYDVFDESRYFQPGDTPGVVEIQGRRFGVTICEDIWNDKNFWREHRHYACDPVSELAKQNVQCVLNLSASPFTLEKRHIREGMLSGLARDIKLPILYVNQVGGNDDLVFDGRSMALNPQGEFCAQAQGFVEETLFFDLNTCTGATHQEDPAPESQLWDALCMGTRDYLRKCHFSKAVLGLSGGIDSALTATIAAQALGPENVTAVLMPSPYSSQGSVDDSLELAKNIGIKTHTLPITTAMQALESTLAPVFSGMPQDVTEENIQARIRGNLVMAISNKTNALALATGNKSELSVGYCTIYGDMAGGLAVIADLPKTMVYALSRWINATHGERIPQSIIDKAPSAELRPDQLDQDSLPPYDILDAILELHVEQHQSHAQIVAQGFESQIVKKILHLVRISEFKRKQAAPGLKVTDRAFGTGWRMPIARKGY